MFFRGSRYEGLAESELRSGPGRLIRYKRIRFIAPAAGLVPHIVEQGERLDHIAFEFYGNPEMFWRICDANQSLHPEELEAEPGRRLLIPLDNG